MRRKPDIARKFAHPYRVRLRELKPRPGIDLDRALRLAGEIEDRETARKISLGR